MRLDSICSKHPQAYVVDVELRGGKCDTRSFCANLLADKQNLELLMIAVLLENLVVNLVAKLCDN